MADTIQEGDLVVATTTDRVLVTIKPDGQLIYGPDYTPDEAATVFWQAFARKRAEAEVRELSYRHMESLLLELGRADLDNEVAQMRAIALGGMGNTGGSAVLDAHRTNATLERTVHRVIELARGLAERQNPEEPVALPRDLN